MCWQKVAKTKQGKDIVDGGARWAPAAGAGAAQRSGIGAAGSFFADELVPALMSGIRAVYHNSPY